MKNVAVLGGGPAGSFAAERLARSGIDTVVLDEKLAWEKPCGGGITYKAYHQYPFLLDNATPKKLVTKLVLSEPRAGSTRLELNDPLLIYSRHDLNKMLLDRAQNAGVRVEKTRVLGLDRTHSGWTVRTRNGSFNADFCVIATGARNSLRDFGTRWSPGDTMTALGYFVPSNLDQIDLQFFPGFQGYIWVFPRCGHLSVGICGKGESAQNMRSRLERYMDECGISCQHGIYYGHMLPSLERPAWPANRVAGEGWMAVGDAAGLVDPITGEGIYYAMRSGDLAGQVLLDQTVPWAAKPDAYKSLLRAECTGELEFGARLAKRFYQDQFFFGSVPARMIQLIRHSKYLAGITTDLISGTQAYTELKKRLIQDVWFLRLYFSAGGRFS
jgi:geranylgeranyl reductase family protein